MTEAGVTHHIVLDDGTTQIGLMGWDGNNASFTSWHRAPMMSTSLKTSSGESEYSDLEPPYYTLAQENWEGGRGQDMLDDVTRFYDSCNAWTKHQNQIILAPCQYMATCKTTAIEHYDAENVGQHSVTIGEDDDDHILGYAVQFSVTSDYTPETVTLFMARRGALSTAAHVYIYLDNFGTPDMTAGPVASGSITASDVQRDTICGVRCSLSAYELKNGNDYWIAVVMDSVFPQVALTPTYYLLSGESGGTCKKTDDTLTWGNLDTGENGYFWYLFDDGNASIDRRPKKFIEYKEAMYMVTYGNPGRIYMNGDRGACDSNSGALGTLVDATKSWKTNEWAGCKAKIIGGPGDGEVRTITSNTGSVLSVSPNWYTTHTTSSAYVIIGSPKWTNVTPSAPSDTIDYYISDVIVSGDWLCIAQGSSHDILMWKEEISSGAWAKTVEDNAKSFRAELLAQQYSSKVNRTYRVYHSASSWKMDFSADSYLDFEDTSEVDMDLPSPVSFRDKRPTSIVVYGNVPYIFTDSSVYTYYKDSLEQLDIDYSSMRGRENGKGAVSYNYFMFFPIMYGLYRTTGKQTDSIGPDKDAGMPANRLGKITSMCPTVDGLYYCIESVSGRSSVMVYNSFGHHEVARGIANACRISALYYQVIDDGPNILWYNEGETIRYIKMPYKTSNPYFDNDVTLIRQGEVVTSWVNLSLAVAYKFWSELTVFSENLGSTEYIEAFYQIDDDDDASEWIYIGSFDTSPVETISLSSSDSVSGRRIRFKFVIHQEAESWTPVDGMFIRYPRIKAWAIDAVSRLESKYSYSATVIVSDSIAMMNDKGIDDTGAAVILAQLDTWANAHTPLTMTSIDPSATDKTVFVEPTEYRISEFRKVPRSDDVPVYYSTLKLIEA